MSAYVKTVISRAIRKSVAQAAEAIRAETERVAKENRLRAQVERSLAEREAAAQKAALSVLADLNQKSLAKLAQLAAITNQAAPSPALTQKQTAQIQPAKTEGPKADPLAQARVAHKILGYFEELNKLNPPAAEGKKGFLAELAGSPTQDRLEIIADSLKTALSREITLAAQAQSLRAELNAIREAGEKLPDANDFLGRVDALASEPTIESQALAEIREEYRLLREKTQKAQDEEFLRDAAEIIQKFLANQGYEVTGPGEIAVGEACLLTDGQPDYRLQCRLDESGSLVFQQLKVAASREEAEKIPDEYELALDKEKTQAFCQTHEKLLKALSDAGLNVKSSVLKKAGEGRLPVLIDRNKAKAKGRAQVSQAVSRIEK
jgi:hypothetical protein